LVWQSFLLRPEPTEQDFEKFKKYTESWKRPAGMEKDAVFNVWSTEEGPPSYSFPPHQAAKAAAILGSEAFGKLHTRLLTAYFTENRNITDENVLKELWAQVGLPSKAFEKYHDPEILNTIISEHNAAVNNGVTGVPAIYTEGFPTAIVGLQDETVYIRILEQVS